MLVKLLPDQVSEHWGEISLAYSRINCTIVENESWGIGVGPNSEPVLFNSIVYNNNNNQEQIDIENVTYWI